MRRKKKNQASRFELIRERIHQNASVHYKVFAIVMGVLFIGLWVSNLVLTPIVQIDEYTLQTPIANENYSYTITEKYISKDHDSLYFKLLVQETQPGLNDFQKLVITPALKGKKEHAMRVDVYSKTSRYYDIVIHNLPDKWGAIRLEIKTDLDKTAAYFIFNEVPKTESYLTLSPSLTFSNELAYLREIAYQQSLIRSEKDIDIPNAIKKTEDDILKIQQEIGQLNTDMVYQTEQQKQTTQQQITSLNIKESALKSDVGKLKKQQAELISQDELLTLKIAEYAKEFQVDILDISTQK